MIGVIARRKRKDAAGWGHGKTLNGAAGGKRPGAVAPIYGISLNSRSEYKVCEEQADILAMNDEQSIPFGPGHPQYLEARALALSIAAIRKAQGKRNPVDFAVGSSDWERAGEDFARDVLRILGSE